jgi:hypothetical protein
MAIRFGVSLATFLVIQLAASAGAQTPAAPKPPANEDCAACHEDAAKPFADSVHAPAACVDCHQDLATLQEFPHPEKLARVSCASCHDEVASQYHDSIHAWAKEKAGLKSAPTCADCHGSHDIRPKADVLSRTSRGNVPKTCGSCHEGIIARYDTSVHAAALAAGRSDAPVCSDCHTAHAIKRSDTPAWRLAAVAECGSCHTDVVDSFRRTFHGKVTELGFTRVATCADCHGGHEILPASHPSSLVSPGRLVETCGRCHEGANQRFVEYDPHPNPRNYERSPSLWWINQFYTVLIAGCFGLFGLHSLLWYRRERQETRRS